jgi:hypothetical protein
MFKVAKGLAALLALAVLAMPAKAGCRPAAGTFPAIAGR